MERFIEPEYCITEYVSRKAGLHWYITIISNIAHIHSEEQDWDLTPMIVWCTENLKSEYKIGLSELENVFIEIYNKEDAMAFKLRWI